MEIDLKAAGMRISEIRKQHNYSMASFAKLIGNSSASTVNNWEKGNNLPKKERLRRIAILGNTTPEWIKYGNFDEYLVELLSTAKKTPQKLTEKQLNLLVQELHQQRVSYENDLEILTVAKKLLPHFFEINYQDTTESLTETVISEDEPTYGIESNLHYRKTILPLLEKALGQKENQQEFTNSLEVFLRFLLEINSSKDAIILEELVHILKAYPDVLSAKQLQSLFSQSF